MENQSKCGSSKGLGEENKKALVSFGTKLLIQIKFAIHGEFLN